jgi:hypothetical protein
MKNEINTKVSDITARKNYYPGGCPFMRLLLLA